MTMDFKIIEIIDDPVHTGKKQVRISTDVNGRIFTMWMFGVDPRILELDDEAWRSIVIEELKEALEDHAI